MKIIRKTLLTSIMLICSAAIFAQDAKTQADALLKQGMALHDAKKYDEAVAKYAEALKLDPTSAIANYETAFSLFASGKGQQAISYLEATLKLNPEMAGAYDMLGSIHDDMKQPDKAIEYYNQGLKVNPRYQRLHYNLSIAYTRAGKYTDGAAEAIAAIKLEPRHASSHRAYALALLGNNNRAAALLGFCSFLILEPQTQRSAEAVFYMKRILNSGIKKNADGSTNMAIPSDLSGKASQQLAIQLAVTAATVDKKNLSPVDSLQLQLETVFNILAEQSAKETPSFYTKYMAGYFGALAASGNMPTYAHFITMTTNREEDKIWLGAHPTEIKTFSDWATTTKREFE